MKLRSRGRTRMRMPAMSATSGPMAKVRVMAAPRGSGLGARAPGDHRQHGMLLARVLGLLALRGALLAHDLREFLLQVRIERRGVMERFVGQPVHFYSF